MSQQLDIDQIRAQYPILTRKIDGHDFMQIRSAFHEAEMVKGQPTVILARTVKGKGISYMENNAGWHGKAPSDEQYETGKAELEALLNGLEAE